MPDNNDNINALYNELKSTYDLGTEDSFREYLSDASNREALRKELAETYDVGDSAAFSQYLGFGSTPAGKTAGTVAKQTSTAAKPRTSGQVVGKTTYQQAGGSAATYTPGAGVKPTAAKQYVKPAATTPKQTAAPKQQTMLNYGGMMMGQNKPQGPVADAPEYTPMTDKEVLGKAVHDAGINGAAEKVWADAEKKTAEAMQKNAEADAKWMAYAPASAGSFTGAGTQIKNMASSLTYHDLNTLADQMYEANPQLWQNAYASLKKKYPQNSDTELTTYAQQYAKQQCAQKVYELAVEKNAPKNATDYFFRKVIEDNSLTKLMNAAARTAAGTPGDMQARQTANQRFEASGHKVAGIAGTVGSMMADPLTYISGGIGSGAAKGSLWLGGKIATEAGVREFSTTLGGRMLTSALASSANMGTYIGGSEALSQLELGGTTQVDKETGLPYVGDYSGKNIGKAALRGTLMGGATGVVSPLIGNVADKAVEKTVSTAGKVGVRTGQFVTSAVAEGTIFAIPDVIEYEQTIKSLADPNSENYIADPAERAKKQQELRDNRVEAYMDAWDDSMAMILGFKASGMAKSAPRRLAELSNLGGRRNVGGFETRLRRMLDGNPSLALTKDEKDELNRFGYNDLAEMVDEYKKASEEGEPKEGEPLPYNRFAVLMADDNVSEAARAKMYYYVTGRILPMSTVMKSEKIKPQLDNEGRVTGYTVEATGANGTITRKTYKDEKSAMAAKQVIDRQAELNGMDIGERYTDAKADAERMMKACEQVARESQAPANTLFELMKKDPDGMTEMERQWAMRVADIYNQLEPGTTAADIRDDVGEKYGVDVDRCIQKEPSRRNDTERKAVEEYSRRLYDGMKSDSDNQGPDFTPEGLYLNGRGPAYHTGYNADDAQAMQIFDEMQFAEEGSDARREAQEAWEGVQHHVEDEAAKEVAVMREHNKPRTNEDDGGIHEVYTKPTEENPNGKTLYIVKGMVTQDADGTIGGEQTIVVYNPESHEREMISPDKLGALGEVKTAQQIDSEMEEYRNKLVDTQMAALRGEVWAGFKVGDNVQLPDGTPAVVNAVENGRVEVINTKDGSHVELPTDELQKQHDQESYAAWKMRHGETPADNGHASETGETPADEISGNGGETPASETGANSGEQMPAAATRPEHIDYESGLEVRISDDGAEKDAVVMGRVRSVPKTDGGNLADIVPDENGNYVQYLMDGEIYYKPIATFDKMVVAVNNPAVEEGDNMPADETSGNGGEQRAAEGVGTPAVAETAAPAAQTAHTAPAAEAVPATPASETGANGGAEVAATAAVTPADEYAALNADPDLEAEDVTAYIDNNLAAAKKALEDVNAKKTVPAEKPKMGTDKEAFKAEKKAWQDKVDSDNAAWQSELDAATAQLERWNAMKALDDAANAEAEAQAKAEAEHKAAEEKAERERVEAEKHAAAVDAEQKRIEEKATKDAEQKRRGANAVHPAIREKWEAATKVEGGENEITLANGETIEGRYVLVESGAATPSHNPNAEFARNEGFPVDKNGQTINDRDYERDKDAQRITRDMGTKYDSRALNDVPVVSADGVVLSGNGRTMAGEIAAQNNTDAAYIDNLKKYAYRFGFTSEQVEGMQHPRVVFVPNEEMPYTTETFAKFNKEDKKSQSRTEQAVKLGKVVDDMVYARIITSINSFDSIAEFYADEKAAMTALRDLAESGAIDAMQMAEMTDGNQLSAIGKQFLENILIGKAFEGNPDAIRMMSEYPAMRQAVISALAEISDNTKMGGDYSIGNNLADAIKLTYDALKSGYKHGELVSGFARQAKLFAFDEGSTVADYNNYLVMVLADILNGKKVNDLKKFVTLYNNNARESASGQIDIFAGGVKTREDITRDVLNVLHYGSKQEIEQRLAEAGEARKRESQQESADRGRQVVPQTGIGNDGNKPDEGAREEVKGKAQQKKAETKPAGKTAGTVAGKRYMFGGADMRGLVVKSEDKDGNLTVAVMDGTRHQKDITMSREAFDKLTSAKGLLGKMADPGKMSDIFEKAYSNAMSEDKSGDENTSWVDGIVSDKKTKAEKKDGNEKRVLDVDGNPAVIEMNDGSVEMNYTTWNEEKDLVRQALADGGMEEDTIEAMIAQADAVAEGMKDLMEKNPAFKEYQLRGAGNRPILRDNGEYISWDYSFNCIKKDAVNAVIDYLVKEGKASHLGVTQIEAVKKILQQSKFLTACAMCYVEGKRKVYKQAKEMEAKWNAVQKAVGLDDAEMGNEVELTAEQQKRLQEFAKGEGLESVENYTKKDGYGIKEDTIKKIATLMLSSPKLRGTMNYEWMISPSSFTNMYNKFAGTGLMEFMTQGQSRGKGLLESEPFSMRSIPADLFIEMYNPIKLANIGGLRQFSYEDARALMFFDYYTQFLVMQGARAPEHLYTKRPFMPEMFGKTGAMMNQSLIVDVFNGAKDHQEALGLSDAEYDKYLRDNAGFIPRGWLPKDSKDYEEGSLELVQAWSVESFPVDKSMANAHNRDFNGTVGNVVVAPSHKFIKWALDNNDIHMILAYHAKGASPIMKSLHGYDKAEAMDDGYHTLDANGKTVANLNVPEIGLEIRDKVLVWDKLLRKQGYDARKAAQVYLQYCKEHGMTPMFNYPECEIDFSGEQATSHPGYYKLLTNFRMYDEDGNSVKQKAVKAVLPENWHEILEKYLAEEQGNANAISNIFNDKELVKKIEVATKYTSIEKDERDTLNNILGSVYGRENVTTLPSDKFDTELDKYTEQGRAQMLRDNGGIVYGFAVGKQMFFNEELFNANTPLHEHTHIYMKVLKATNPKLYNAGMELWRGTQLWEDAKRGLEMLGEEPTDDQIFSEAMSQFNGSESEKIISKYTGITDKGWLQKAMDWLKEMWSSLKSAFEKWSKKDLEKLTPEQFARMPLRAIFDEKERERYADIVKKINDIDGKASGSVEMMAEKENRGGIYGNDFKKFFGDWELARKKVDIVPAEAEHGFKNLDDAEKWAKENITGEYENPEIGLVNISGRSIEKYLSGKAVKKSVNAEIHMSSLKVMPEIIKKSIVGEIHEDNRGSKNIRDIVRLYGCISIYGINYRVKTTVKRYNTDNEKTRAYSYEVTEIELLDGALGDVNKPLPQSSSNSITAAKLLNNVDSDKKNGEKILNISKVVDENGMPLVVYHGSPKAGFTVFSNEEGPIWASGSEAHANRYGKFDESKEGLYDKNTYPLYMDIKKPIDVGYLDTTCLESKDFFRLCDEFDMDPEELMNKCDVWEFKNALAYQTTVEKVENHDDAVEAALNSTPLYALTRSKGFMELAKEHGYDGITAVELDKTSDNNPNVRTWAAFEPSQVKSATGNNGDYNTEDNDIRFREADVNDMNPASKEFEFTEETARKAGYTKKQYEAFLKRVEQNARRQFKEMVERLGLNDRVELRDTAEGLGKRFANKKGWFDPKTGKIVVILANHPTVDDVKKTILHEAVGHYGLRKLFGKYFDKFLDQVYETGDEGIRKGIDELTEKKGYDKHRATEEYLSHLAEDIDYERAEYQSWMSEVKRAFWSLLSKVGILFNKIETVTDNELRYILWRSYKNLTEPGRYRTPVEMAEDISKQYELKVGDYEERARDGEDDTDPDRPDGGGARVRFRDGEEDEEESLKDIMGDGSVGMAERLTAAKVMMANNHKNDYDKRNEALHELGKNLRDIRSAASVQRTFDQNTVKRVADLARVMLANDMLGKEISKGDVKAIASIIKNSTGKADLTAQVNRLFDIMLRNQQHIAEAALERLEKIKGGKVDAKGINVQGKLDVQGQTVMAAFKAGKKMSSMDDLETKIAEAQNDLTSTDKAIADEAALELKGLEIARDFRNNIQQTLDEIDDLQNQIRKASRTTKEERQYVDSLEDALRDSRVELIEAYNDVVKKLSGIVEGSIEQAKAFKEAEVERVREIQHNANSDLEGKPSEEHYKPGFLDKVNNGAIPRFFLQPLLTFEQMMRMFGKKSPNGEGYLYNRFVRGSVEAREKELKGFRSKVEVLDAKAKEAFGVKNWATLITKVGRMPKVVVAFRDGSTMEDHELTQDEALYIYMVNKMADGRMKLRKMGITEEAVSAIRDQIDPRLIVLGDWMQDDFLVQTRNEYNETHKRMFGASMSSVEHYFPLKINSNSRVENADELNQPKVSDGVSTKTGAIIKRRRNNTALDLLNAGALSVVVDHLQQMEHWNAYAEFNRDLNTLRTYKHFKNQVYNMRTIYGSGKELWDNFNKVCEMVSGVYDPAGKTAATDKAIQGIAKGVSTAKVSFRVFTAFKQLTSIPAFIMDTNPLYMAESLLNPISAWKWCMKNLPIFEERWKSRMGGDPRLVTTELDWKAWRNDIVNTASRIGMSPNAFMDALAVTMGARAVYKTRYDQYMKAGYDKERADKMAKQDATVAFNQSQQSSEGAFTSPMQVDRTVASTTFSLFRNASMGYTRQSVDSLRNIIKNLQSGYKDVSIAFTTKQLMRDGLSEEAAEKEAKRRYMRQVFKNPGRLALFAFVLPWIWNVIGKSGYLLFGDDGDDKKKTLHDETLHSLMGLIEGLTGGDVVSTAASMLMSGEKINSSYLRKELPITADIYDMVDDFANGKKAEAINQIINIAVQIGIGVNPQSLYETALGISDACGDDPELAHEAAIFIMRLTQMPSSQIDEVYFDEVGMTGKEASKYTPAQLARRYAEYKVKRGRFFEPWTWDDEEAIDKKVDTANKKIKERLQESAPKEVNDKYDEYAETFGENDKVLKAAKKKGATEYAEAISKMNEADPDAYRDYRLFKNMDKNLDKMVKKYMESRTPEEALMWHDKIVDYKTKMVEELGK